MIELSYEQKQSLGFQFILDSLNPSCVYGQEEARKSSPYPAEQRQELQEELIRLQNMVQGYEACKIRIERISMIFMQMKEIRGSLKRGRDSILNDIELFELKQFLLSTEKWKQELEQLLKIMELPGIFVNDTREALDILDPEQRRIPGFYIVDAYSEKLKEIRELKKHLEVVLRQELSEEKKSRLMEKRKEQVVLEEEEQQRIRIEITEKLRPYLAAIGDNAKMAGKLDFLIQKAAIAKRYGGICPEITQDQLELQNMVNPEILESLKARNKVFAPVSFSMNCGTAVVTGANMGGKSVSLRTIALNIVLGQSGFFVYAQKARIPMFDYICMVAEEFQSIQNGLSSFGGEIMELQKAIEQLDRGFGFLMFDELARGTNPDEGSAIVQAVVKFLNTQNAMTVVATHYDHVAEFADYHYQVLGLKNVDLERLETEIRENSHKKGIDIISRYMDYGIYRVHGREECPRDAIHICGLLGLDRRIMEMIQY